jgi:hypothetical protein
VWPLIGIFHYFFIDGNTAFADVDLNASGLLPLQAEAEGVHNCWVNGYSVVIPSKCFSSASASALDGVHYVPRASYLAIRK